MKLEKFGERALIEMFEKKFSRRPKPDGSRLELKLAIGDDAAVIKMSETESMVVTVDTLVENIDFRLNTAPGYTIGHKSLAVNLSDVAAMGARPQFVLSSVALPPDLEVGWIEEWSEGFAALAEKSGVTVIGGDVSQTAGPIVFSVTVIGSNDSSKIKRRSDAKRGDIICVTGTLGDSSAGLRLLEENYDDVSGEEWMQQLTMRHLLPNPRVKNGEWLGAQDAVRAMIDISDGLATDLKHIIIASQAGAEIHFDKIPVSKELIQLSQKIGVDPMEFAVSGGEDYELLLTVDPNRFESVSEAYRKQFGEPLIAIGRMTEKRELVFIDRSKEVNWSRPGFEHFKSRLR
jgi:thiamine-monophosphate kinase